MDEDFTEGLRLILLAKKEGDPGLTILLNSCYNLGLLHSFLLSSSSMFLMFTWKQLKEVKYWCILFSFSVASSGI